MKELNKRLVLAVRLILFFWGMIAGWTFAEFIFGLYPDYLTDVYELIIKIVNAAVFGAVFSTLARPVSSLALFVGRSLRRAFIDKPLYITGSVVLGFVIGIMFGVLANAIVEIFTSLFVARFIIAFAAAAVGWYVGYLGCKRWLSSAELDEENIVIEYSGYILAYGAFFSDKVIYVSELLNGRIYVLGRTLIRLIELSDSDAAAKKALENYLRLSEYSDVRIVNDGSERTEEEAIAALAKSKLLKVIVGFAGEIEDGDVKVLSLADL